MTGGLLISSPLMRRLLSEHLTLERCIFFHNQTDLTSTLHAGHLKGALIEEPAHLLIVTPHGIQQIFPKPVQLQKVLSYWDFLTTDHCHAIGPYWFYPEKRLLETKKPPLKTISLREKETELILFLLASPQRQASREKLLQHIWRFQTDVETQTLESHIYHLRQKIEAVPDFPKILVNTRGGYQLT